MNVWVVSFDESEDACDPLLRVFSTALDAKHAIRKMAQGTPFDIDELEELDEFTLNYYDPEEGDRLMVVLRQVRIERPEVVMAEGKL